jgi:hypothetical protein
MVSSDNVHDVNCTYYSSICKILHCITIKKRECSEQRCILEAAVIYMCQRLPDAALDGSPGAELPPPTTSNSQLVPMTGGMGRLITSCMTVAPEAQLRL